MREILKFRAWDGLNKVFTYWTMNDLCNHTDLSVEKPSFTDEWMLFIGHKDKNGKEIYEGDIVRSGALLLAGAVYWDKYMWNVKDYYDASADNPTDAFSEGVFEVIGNIYENPELQCN